MKSFIKKKENFVCEKCGNKVSGDGYTNHCPECLWSKHVDINPGDRTEKCQAMMKPVSLEIKSGKYFIVFECIKCKFKRKNKLAENDNFDTLLNIVKNSKILKTK